VRVPDPSSRGVTVLEYDDEEVIVDTEAGHSLELCKPAVPSCSEPSPPPANNGATAGEVWRLSDCHNLQDVAYKNVLQCVDGSDGASSYISQAVNYKLLPLRCQWSTYYVCDAAPANHSCRL
jgi:hypothetical protein